MTPDRFLRGSPPGLVSGLLFFAVVFLGCGYIVFSKTHEFAAFYVTSVPVLIMIAYAAALGLARLFRLRDDQSGDNLYYMGFLFTLTSLAVSLYQFSASGSAEQIVQNFGIAIASTIAGIALRIFFNQMRRDPVEVEHVARLELAEASRKVKRERIVPKPCPALQNRAGSGISECSCGTWVEEIFLRKRDNYGSDPTWY